jgi:exonuclease I
VIVKVITVSFNRLCFTIPIQVLKAEQTTRFGLQFGVVA